MEHKILIVDDEDFIRLLIEQALEDLEDEGVILLPATNGQEALDMIQAEKPNLVFLDVMMPKVNGFEVCKAIRQNPDLKDIYIIMLTAKGQVFDKQKGQAVGANTYMTKPFDPDLLLEKAREVLGL